MGFNEYLLKQQCKFSYNQSVVFVITSYKKRSNECKLQSKSRMLHY